ncbi:MAG: serine/threonine-protein kinase [Phycisphaerales bacterium]
MEDPVALTPYKANDTVEGYRVMSELGRGAASIIYLVQDPKTKQIWALKHVEKTPDAKDNRFLDQAELEYQIASKLDHRGIRRIERMIKKKEGLLSSAHEIFLVMELVDGISLEKAPPKTFDGAADVFEQVARAMSYMHTRGFVHADMKPNNVIVDGEGTAKIVDLGQSCTMNTVKKRIQGTPDYIAPEQVHRRPITAKTDIYNLGATMYWVLTRKFVPTALAKSTSLVGSVDDALMEKPTPVCELNRRVPEMFSKLIMDCVEVEPAMRPESMDSVADRLNLIKARLIAESELRKSGNFRNVQEGSAGSRAGGSRAGGSGSWGSRAAGSSKLPEMPTGDDLDDELRPDEDTKDLDPPPGRASK